MEENQKPEGESQAKETATTKFVRKEATRWLKTTAKYVVAGAAVFAVSYALGKAASKVDTEVPEITAEVSS